MTEHQINELLDKLGYLLEIVKKMESQNKSLDIRKDMNVIEKINIDDILLRADALIKEGKDFIMSGGKVLELAKWLTIAKHAQKYNMTTQVVSKWIERGIIEQEDYVEIGKFEKILVRDVMHKS